MIENRSRFRFFSLSCLFLGYEFGGVFSIGSCDGFVISYIWCLFGGLNWDWSKRGDWRAWEFGKGSIAGYFLFPRWGFFLLFFFFISPLFSGVVRF